MELVKKIRTQGYSEMFWNCKTPGIKSAQAPLPAALQQQQEQQQQAASKSKDKNFTKITFSVHSQLDEMAQRLLEKTPDGSSHVDRDSYHLLRLYDQVFWLRFLREPANALWSERKEGCYFAENKKLYLQSESNTAGGLVPAIAINAE